MRAQHVRRIDEMEHDSRDVDLAHALADGRPHRLDALATIFDAATDPHASPEAALLESLDRLAALGMRLMRRGDEVRTTRFVPLSTDGLRQALVDRASHWRGRVEPVVTSTSAVLASEARSRAVAMPYLLASELQEAGRGRRGRGWRAAPGASLTASYAWRIERPVAALEGLSLVCGLAIHDVLRRHGIDARLKWPNDVLVDDRKLAGILVETVADRTTLLVVGVGINVLPLDSQAIDASALSMTDLHTCGCIDVDRHALAAELASRLDDRLATFLRDGFASYPDAFNAADAFLGRRVSVQAGEGRPLLGIDRGVDANGALLVECDGRLVRCVAGDVSLRPASA